MIDKSKLCCPLCGGGLETGTLLDCFHGMGACLQAQWVRGVPEKKLLSPAYKLKGTQRRPIDANRCTQCGYLMLFATRLTE